MTFDWSKLGVPAARSGEVDPIKLFGSLQLQDKNVNDLWLGQGDALRSWHIHRAKDDVAIVLNTGAGKTLVGLLAAQSLVNETQGHVVYLCASIQLVQQTADKATSYGLPVSTYISGPGFNNTVYTEGRGPCITTYQAVFNGLTRRWNDVKAVIFDDAHAATSIIRDQFTLKIDKRKHAAVFNAVAAAHGAYLRETSSDLTFREAVAANDQRERWLVPPFVIRRNIGELNTALLAARLSDDADGRYAWGFLGSKLRLCATFISGESVWFTPPVVPVRSLSYFRSGVRRLYLSATLAADDAFLRTFGKVPDEVVAPSTPAGKCERMVLFPCVAADATDDVHVTKAVIATQKALILVPGKAESQVWNDIVTEGPGESVATHVDEFKRAPAPAKLRLVARYDGVDLPGDTCRMMVVHGLPSGLGPLERFMWERLGIFNVLRSTVASRIVQSFGRISRGMADHGVVLVAGRRLVEWLLNPANRQSLPAFLKRQVEVGIDLSKGLTAAQFPGMALQCIAQDTGWRGFYGRMMAGADSEPDHITEPDMVAAARIEADFGLHLWNEDFEAAARTIHSGRNALFSVSKGLGAWYLLWQGHVHDIMGDADGAVRLYRDARQADRAIPPFAKSADGGEAGLPDAEQVKEIVDYMSGSWDVLARFDLETANLEGTSVPQAEEAARCLGAFLGLDSSRPDNDVGTGPDVLWMIERGTAWSLELKTGKKVSGSYPKRSVAQVGDHVQWVKDHKHVGRVVPAFVGPRLPADDKANPLDGLIVVTVQELIGLRLRVRAAIETVTGNRLPLMLPSEVRRVFGEAGLLWSSLSANIPGVLLKAVAKLP